MLIRELAALLKANIPLMTALDILGKQYPLKLQKLIFSLRQDISDGFSLSQAMQKHPHYFKEIHIHIIKAGEISAALPHILESIACYEEKMELLKKRFKKALFYPITVLCFALLITLGLLIFIVPQFENLFESMGAQLPWMTRMVLSLTAWIKTYGILILAFFLLIIPSYWLAKKYFSYFSKLSYVLLHLPVVGKIIQKIIFSRFSHTLALLLNARIALTEALKIAGRILPSYPYQKAMMSARENIIQGDALSHALGKSQQFPFIFLQFIHIGEQSGSLPQMLTQIGQRYEIETDHQLQTLTLLLEPLIMLILGVLIGGLVIAMYLPVFQLGKMV